MRITNIEKINPISFESIMISSRVFTALVVFTFLFFFFSSVSDIVTIIFHIPDVYATLDTFYARGIIFIPIGDSKIVVIVILIQKHNYYHHYSSSLSSPNQSTTSINNNNNNSINNTTNTNTNNIITKEEEQNNNNMSKIKNIKGQWTLKVNKGSPQIFNSYLYHMIKMVLPRMHMEYTI